MKALPSQQRQPWHYDAFAGRPDWSKQLGRQHVIQRQRKNLESRRRKAVAG